MSEEYICIYDPDCGMCQKCMNLGVRLDRHNRLRPVGNSETEAEELLNDLTLEQRLYEFHIVLPDGTRHSGAAGMFYWMSLLLPFGRCWFWPLTRIPGVMFLSRKVYRLVADNRLILGCKLPQNEES
jgi:predicted DCC family thiol-disulfide oxidoreductase YuxK